MSRQIWAGFARNKSIYFVSISVIARPSRSVSGSSRSLVASWPIISTNLPFLPHFAKIRGITNPANSTLHPPPFFFFLFFFNRMRFTVFRLKPERAGRSHFARYTKIGDAAARCTRGTPAPRTAGRSALRRPCVKAQRRGRRWVGEV